MPRRRSILVLAVLAGLAALPPAPVAFAGEGAKRIDGPARVVDGDTVEIGGARIRLLEIDAPERDQTCRDRAGAVYACGAESTRALTALIAGAPVSCRYDDIDRYGRPLARCAAGGRDLGEAMVAAGQATIYQGRPILYGSAEARAKAAKLGMWQGEFVSPAEFRRTGDSGSGALTGPALDAGLEAAKGPGNGCEIKGNISGSGKIYHRPGQADYAKTRIDPAKGERWFCTEAEARAAGWRPATR